MGSVLVVGGTGILAPAAAALVAEGERVTVLSRGNGSVPAGADARIADARDADALRAALGDDTWDRALVYSPTVTDESHEILCHHVAGRCVLVRTSAAVDPERGEPDVPRDTLQLGWVPPEAGRPSRWHTAVEVSRAALELLDDGESRVLGAIRPWRDRPA